MTIFVTENSQAQCGTNASRRTPQATKHRVAPELKDKIILPF